MGEHFLCLLPNPTQTAVSADSQLYEYTTANGQVTITKYCGNESTVHVPEALDGMAVTAIGDGAFFDCSFIQELTLPNGLKSIGSDAFSMCTSLTAVTIPDTVEVLGQQAFGHCNGLTSITIPRSITVLPACTFYECYSLRSVFLPDGMTEIGDACFYRCMALDDIYIPASVSAIGADVFNSANPTIYTEADSHAAKYAKNQGLTVAD